MFVKFVLPQIQLSIVATYFGTKFQLILKW